jgi:CxxC-x17-CxxC domain-containing protein
MVSADRMLICRECGNEFVFTAGEQGFYAERGFVPPSRCPACRSRRRMERQSSGDDYSAGNRAGDGARGPRPLFPAVCADCGRDTMVPFEPRPGRAVYCRDCFANHRDEYQ